MTTFVNNGQASFKGDLEAAFELLQEQRSALLAKSRSTQLAASLLLAQEARRLAAVAAPGDPRAARLAASSASMLRRVAALDVEAQIAAIRVPVASRSETVIQGRVTDLDALAVGRVQVTLVDARGAAVAGVAPVETDDSGYYAFVLQPAQVANIPATQTLTLQVGSGGSQIVPAAIKPFTLGPGRVIAADAPLQVAEVGRLRVQPVFTAPGGSLASAAPAASTTSGAPAASTTVAPGDFAAAPPAPAEASRAAAPAPKSSKKKR